MIIYFKKRKTIGFLSFFLFVITDILILYFWGNNDFTFSLSITSYFLLLYIAIIFLLTRRSITDASIIFISLFIIYQIILPFIYNTGITWVYSGDFFVSNYMLSLKGNIYSTIGLLSYIFGTFLYKKTKKSKKVEIKKYDFLSGPVAKNIVIILFLFSFLSWVLIFIKLGMPTEVFIGRSPASRYRSNWETGGFGYFTALTFLFNIGFLLYFFTKPNKSLFSLSNTPLYVALIFINSIHGQRLLLIMAPLSVLYIRLLQNTFKKRLSRNSKSDSIVYKRKKRLLPIILVVISLLFIATWYSQYRSGQEHIFTKKNNLFFFFLANTFDTSITYFQVIDKVPSELDYWYGKSLLAPILFRIPTYLYPEKYENIWSSVKYTKLFYGYDQTDPGTVARGASMLAEAYLNFGIYGIAILMFFFGVFNEFISCKVHNINRSNMVLVLYVLYLLYFLVFSFKAGIISAITFFDIRIIPFLLLVFIINLPYQKRI